MYKATCSLKQTVRYEETINPEAEGEKKQNKGEKSTFDSSLPYMFAWPPCLVRTWSKALWQIFILCQCRVSIYPLLHNSGYRMPSKPPETQDTSQNLKQNLNLNFLKLLSVSSLVFNHRMFNFEESLDYWMLHLAQNTVQMHTAASKHIKLRVRLRKFISHPTGTF